MKVPSIGAKTFEQCAGFLNVYEGLQPLDATRVHPESYAAAVNLLKLLHSSSSDVGSSGLRDKVLFSSICRSNMFLIFDSVH